MKQVFDLAAVMSSVASTLGEPGDLEHTLARITHAARDTVPGVDYSSISIRRNEGPMETRAPTNPLVFVCDQMQNELREGPCYDVVTNEQVTYSEDLGLDGRWPTYGRRAAQLGMSSQLAIRLHTDPATLIGLNLYSHRRSAFADALPVAEVFVSHAKVALGYAHEVDTLKAALETRTVIGKAIGIVMERYGLSEERAFEFLIRVSQQGNVKLRIVAANIVAAGDSKGGSNLAPELAPTG